MKQNFGRDKKRIEELKKKRKEEKRLKRLNKSQNPSPDVQAQGDAPLPETMGPSL